MGMAESMNLSNYDGDIYFVTHDHEEDLEDLIGIAFSRERADRIADRYPDRNKPHVVKVNMGVLNNGPIGYAVQIQWNGDVTRTELSHSLKVGVRLSLETSKGSDGIIVFVQAMSIDDAKLIAIKKMNKLNESGRKFDVQVGVNGTLWIEPLRFPTDVGD